MNGLIIIVVGACVVVTLGVIVALAFTGAARNKPSTPRDGNGGDAGGATFIDSGAHSGAHATGHHGHGHHVHHGTHDSFTDGHGGHSASGGGHGGDTSGGGDGGGGDGGGGGGGDGGGGGGGDGGGGGC